MQARIRYSDLVEFSLGSRFSEWFDMAANPPIPLCSQEGLTPNFRQVCLYIFVVGIYVFRVPDGIIYIFFFQKLETVTFLSENVSKAVRAVVPDYESGREPLLLLGAWFLLSYW